MIIKTITPEEFLKGTARTVRNVRTIYNKLSDLLQKRNLELEIQHVRLHAIRNKVEEWKHASCLPRDEVEELIKSLS
jgi:hypothetical protein